MSLLSYIHRRQNSEDLRLFLTFEVRRRSAKMTERANRTIVEKSRCMIYEAKLSKTFWAEVTAVYIINRSPSRGIATTPEENLISE